MASAVSPFCFGLALGLAFGGKIFQYLQLFAEKWPFFGPQNCPHIGAQVKNRNSDLEGGTTNRGRSL